MYPTRPDNTKQKIIATVVVLVAVALLGSVVKAYNHRQASPVIAVSSPPPAAQEQTPPGTGSNQTPSSSNFNDGSYSATADYYVPNGQESIQVTLTVKGGTVTNSSIQNSETNPESAQFQEYFASQYKSQVVGKNLSGLQISYIAGASDTTQAFNSALERIQSQAKA